MGDVSSALSFKEKVHEYRFGTFNCSGPVLGVAVADPFSYCRFLQTKCLVHYFGSSIDSFRIGGGLFNVDMMKPICQKYWSSANMYGLTYEQRVEIIAQHPELNDTFRPAEDLTESVPKARSSQAFRGRLWTAYIGSTMLLVFQYM